jgi:hypothetical protein
MIGVIVTSIDVGIRDREIEHIQVRPFGGSTEWLNLAHKYGPDGFKLVPEHYLTSKYSEEQKKINLDVVVQNIREIENTPPYKVCQKIGISGCMESVCRYGRGVFCEKEIKNWYDSKLKDVLTRLRIEG